MKVNWQNNNQISHKGFYNNKLVKKGLEFAADNGTLFAATTSLALSALRPIVILATPKTDKKNKQIASAKSLTSSINGYLIALVCSYPLSKSIKKINNNPEIYLKKETLTNLKDAKESITSSKAYIMATQLFKLGLGFLIAAPKAVLTAIGTPYLVNLSDSSKNIEQKKVEKNNSNPAFKQKDRLASEISKIINKKAFQDFVKKNKDSNFPLHIVAGTDILATGAFINQTQKSKKFSEKEKKPLIYNSLIATSLSIISTYFIDSMTKNSTEKFVKKFSENNKRDLKLSKYIEGIKIAKPILIAGTIYYIVIPIISTFLADRIKEKKNYSSTIDMPSASAANSTNL